MRAVGGRREARVEVEHAALEDRRPQLALGREVVEEGRLRDPDASATARMPTPGEAEAREERLGGVDDLLAGRGRGFGLALAVWIVDHPSNSDRPTGRTAAYRAAHGWQARICEPCSILHADPGTRAALRSPRPRPSHGQDDAKMGLVLALVAREHAYLEGSAGLREVGAGAGRRRARRARGRRSSPSTATPARPTCWARSHLRRERAARGSGERISLELARGSAARAPRSWCSTTSSRAPGEALAPLLRVLGERRARRPARCRSRARSRPPARRTSRATPIRSSRRQLDRFAMQVRMRGLVGWRAASGVARALLDARAEPPLAPRCSTPNGVMRCSARPRRSPIVPAARAALLRAVESLRARLGRASRRCSPIARSRAPRPRSCARTRCCAAPRRSSPPTCARSASCSRAACPRRSSRTLAAI